MHFSAPIAFAAAFQVARAAQGTLAINNDAAFGAATFGLTGKDIHVPETFWGTISKTANVSISVPVTGYSVTSPYNNQTLDGWTLNLHIQQNIPVGGGGFVAGSAIQLVAPDSQKTDAAADWEICAWVYRTPNAKGAATGKGSCVAVAPNNCLQKKVAGFLANPKCWGLESKGDQDPCVPTETTSGGAGMNFDSQVERGHNKSTTTWAQFIETANSTHAAGDTSDYDDLVNDIYVVALKWFKSDPNFDRDASSPDSPGQPSDIPALGQVVCLSTKNSNGTSVSKSDKSGAAGVAVSVSFGLAAAFGAAIFAL